MGLARSAEQAGISYPQLLETIIRAALERPTTATSGRRGAATMLA